MSNEKINQISERALCTSLSVMAKIATYTWFTSNRRMMYNIPSNLRRTQKIKLKLLTITVMKYEGIKYMIAFNLADVEKCISHKLKTPKS